MDFKQVVANPESLRPELFQERYNVSFHEACLMAEQAQSEALFISEEYQVTMSQPFLPKEVGYPRVVHLSVIRLDGEPVHKWSDLQKIKNQLVGSEYEAVEVYPAESRLVDMGNNYHLWVFMEKVRVPFGWSRRMVKGEAGL